MSDNDNFEEKKASFENSKLNQLEMQKMSDLIVLQKFGQVVLDYFLINYPNTYSFKLSIDDYTFSELAMMAGEEEDRIIKAIQKKDTSYSNDLEALAIAAYQVKIVGDIESIQSSGSDSYYQKIKDNYDSYKNSDNNSICNGYFSNQIFLWGKVKSIFERYGRSLTLPSDHYGAGRFVQYPVKSHELKNSELLEYANIFIHRGLQPYDITITYQAFCSLMFPYNRNESFKRTIFNFYKIWDGRTKGEILSRSARTNSHRDLNTVDTNIVLDYLESKIVFYNQESGERVLDYSKIQQLLFSYSNKVIFVQNEDNDFYSAKKNKIDYGLNFVVISKNALQIPMEDLINDFHQACERELLNVYYVQFSKEVCSKLGIETAQKPPVSLVGGLKKSRNTYYTFCLPAIEFSQPLKEMYINANRIDINSNRIELSSLPCLETIKEQGGKVTIRFSDYLPINFTVVEIDTDSVLFDEIGWDFSGARYLPVSIKNETDISVGSIVGFSSTIEFEPIKVICKENNKRAFIIHKEYLEKRFSKRKEF